MKENVLLKSLLAVRVAIWLSTSCRDAKSVNSYTGLEGRCIHVGKQRSLDKNGNRKKKVSMESKLPCLLPSMLRHTVSRPEAKEHQIHPVTDSNTYSCAAFPIGSDTKAFKVVLQS